MDASWHNEGPVDSIEEHEAERVAPSPSVVDFVRAILSVFGGTRRGVVGDSRIKPPRKYPWIGY